MCIPTTVMGSGHYIKSESRKGSLEILHVVMTTLKSRTTHFDALTFIRMRLIKKQCRTNLDTHKSSTQLLSI